MPAVLLSPAPLTARERRALRRRVPVRPDWACENCTAPNAGTRKRCADCGTTRD